jgi:hypothetical protein
VRFGEFGTRGYCNVRNMNSVIEKVFFRRALPLSESKFDAEFISGDARAIYCELVSLEREVTVTFEI